MHTASRVRAAITLVLLLGSGCREAPDVRGASTAQLLQWIRQYAEAGDLSEAHARRVLAELRSRPKDELWSVLAPMLASAESQTVLAGLTLLNIAVIRLWLPVVIDRGTAAWQRVEGLLLDLL